MSESQELVPQVTPEQEKALVAKQAEAYTQDDLVVPMLKVSHPQSSEVQEGDVEAGHFYNSLTGEDFGPAIEYVVAAYDKGRFRYEDGKLLAGFGSIQCGCHEVPFVECPDSEELYRERVRAGEIEWGSGPPVQTTYNFTGYVVTEDGLQEIPVRLSLKATQTKAAKNFATLLRFQNAPWDSVFELELEREQNKKGAYYVPRIKVARTATPDERQSTVALAQAVHAGSARFEDQEQPERATPAPAKDALDID